MFQCPGVGVGAFAHRYLYHRGEVGRQRLPQRRTQFCGRFDPHTTGAASPRHRGIIDAVRLPIALEYAAEFGVVMHVLEACDGAERRVIHHHPNHREIGLHGGRHHRHIAAESAIADERDRGTVGLRVPLRRARQPDRIPWSPDRWA